MVYGVTNLNFETRKQAAEAPATAAELLQDYPLNINKPVYKLTVSGKVNLSKPNSLARVVLIDNQQNEYLVYEAYPLISSQGSFSFGNACEETCLLDGVTPASLRIEGENASLTITNVSTLNNRSQISSQAKTKGVAVESERLRQAKVQSKITKMQTKIPQLDLKWTAGETSVSNLTYAQKKKLFSNPDGTPVIKLPNLQGFEYYKGGVFEIKSDQPETVSAASSSGLPSSWDWRYVHGENWLTPVKDQGQAGNCGAFSLIGAMEAGINTYYNQHLDVDLSEQMWADCASSSTPPLGMDPAQYGNELCMSCNPGNGYCAIGNHGLADEQCDPYAQREFHHGDANCNNDNICGDWADRSWKVTDFQNYRFKETSACRKEIQSRNVEDLKGLLIENGPVEGQFAPWNHAMALVGYNTTPNDYRTIWIFKNSWGVNFGDAGYALIRGNLSDIGSIALPIKPIPPASQNINIRCVDNDSDDYCNWGVSEKKPATCPSFCKPEKDCDDSDQNIGGPGGMYNRFCPATATTPITFCVVQPLPNPCPAKTLCAIKQCSGSNQEDTNWSLCSQYDYDGDCRIGMTDIQRCASRCLATGRLGDCCDTSIPCQTGFICQTCFQSQGECVVPLRVFVTSQTYQGNLGGLVGADAKCQSLTTAAGLSGNFKAWLSESSASAKARFNVKDLSYYLVSGEKVAENFADLIDGSLDRPIDHDEKGAEVDPYASWTAWTGTEGRGLAVVNLCSNWTTSSSQKAGEVGNININDSFVWTAFDAVPCNQSNRLYCFEDTP